jgi:dTDP-4-dehydrorhamnose 3,5-epimerase-like enzyme
MRSPKKDVIGSLRRISFPQFAANGGLTVFESKDAAIPFEIRRVFTIADVPPRTTRGNHAHRRCSQLLVCVAGAISVGANDGYSQETIALRGDGVGLLIPPMIWNSITFELEKSVLLVFCDLLFDEDEYIRDWKDFTEMV